MSLSDRILHSDNHCEISQNNANYSRCNSYCLNANPIQSRRMLVRCKSDFNIERWTKINNRMGVTVSRRSKSSDNISTSTDSFVYEPLNRTVAYIDAEVSDNDDYKLLDNSTDDNLSSEDNDNDNSLNIIALSNASANCDGHNDNNEQKSSCTSIITKSTNEKTAQMNVNVDKCLNVNERCAENVIRKFSTLPRLKSRENIARQEDRVRKSCKITTGRVYNTNEDEFQDCRVTIDKSRDSTIDTSDDNNEKVILRTENSKSDRMNELTFHSTTLPKARSRLSEPQFRHSLRYTIDSDNSRKYLSECNASGSNNNSAESTSGTRTSSSSSKVKRSRSNLSWLRKSMKKLNPFQMPQEIESPSNNTAPPSTSNDINPPSNNIECEKENIQRENHQHEGVSDLLRSPVVNNENVPNETFLPENPDIFNVVLLEQQQGVIESRPRQYGRRSNPIRISSIAAESVNHAAARIIAHHQQQERPNSAPVSHTPSQRASHRPRQSLPSEPSSLASSRNSSPVSMVSSTNSSSIPDTINAISDIHSRFTASNSQDDEERDQNENSNETKTFWPHLLSRPISCLFCTLGLFNISRFAIFSVHFGANFLVQFLLLSFMFGIPFLWLQIVLGHKIKGGIVTMFRITPICKGIGISLMISHCIICLYSSVSLGWVLIYLRDSMISSDEHYLWEERFDSFRSYQNISALRLSENIADYFNGVVLQRLSGLANGNGHDGKMRFQLAFNVSIVWMLVFIILSRGIKSMGKIMIFLCLFCFLSLAAICIKFLTLLNFETVQDIFPATDWQEFFGNSNSWSVAAQEAFLTWALLGVSIYAMYCKSGKNQRLNHHYILRREALLIVFLTLFGLFLGGILGSTCVIILKLNGFNYFPASFENPKNDIFLWPMHYATLPHFHHSIPSKWITRYSNVIGESFERPIFVNQQGNQVYKETGFKPIRLISEILPSTLAISSRIEPIWGTLAFLCLFFFGVCQLSVMWKSISGAIGNSTSAILLSCVTGLFLGVPLTTDNGIIIMHFLDFVFGGSWFLPVLWTSYLLAIFMVRGRPYSSDFLVKELRLTETLSAFVAFSWNVLLPVSLVLLSIMEYKKSHSTELFHQRNMLSLSHLSNWPLWVKQVGGLLQVSLLILLPCVALIQIYIYLSKGPRDILERIERLFRPPMESGDSTAHVRLCQTNFTQSPPTQIALSEGNANVNVINDEPPKYSPPPSYGKAMGLRVAKALRRSIRRFRRSDVVNEATNVPTISSVVNASQNQPFQRASQSNSDNLRQNLSNIIRNSFRNRTSQSREHLVLSDISPSMTNEHIV